MTGVVNLSLKKNETVLNTSHCSTLTRHFVRVVTVNNDLVVNFAFNSFPRIFRTNLGSDVAFRSSRYLRILMKLSVSLLIIIFMFSELTGQSFIVEIVWYLCYLLTNHSVIFAVGFFNFVILYVYLT